MNKELLLVEMDRKKVLCTAPAYRASKGDLVEADGKLGRVLMSAPIGYGSEPLFDLVKEYLGKQEVIYKVDRIYYESKVINEEGE